MKQPAKAAKLFLVSFFVSFSAFSFAQQAIKLTLAHNAAVGNPKAEGSNKFAELVSAKSNGRIIVQVSGASQLGDDMTTLSALRTGTLDLNANSQGALSSIVPEVAALGLPFQFPTMQDAWKVIDGPIGKELEKKVEAKNIMVLAWFDGGIRQVTNNKRLIAKPDDLKGLKLRTPNDPTTIDTFQAMGSATQQINFGELYIAIQQGVVDGQENPLANILTSKVYEVQKYISMTNHKWESTPLLMSKYSWKKLSEADQKLIMEAAVEATRFQRNMMLEMDARLLEEFKKNPNLEINTTDMALFKEATKEVWDNWEKKPFGDFVKKLRASIH